MKRKVTVAEPKPALRAKALRSSHELPTFVGTPPSIHGVCLSRQRIQQRVDIGRNMKTEVAEVIASIHDCDHVFGRQHLRKTLHQL
jgi:hypothetical protein